MRSAASARVQVGRHTCDYRIMVEITGNGTYKIGVPLLNQCWLTTNNLMLIWDLSDPGGKGYLDKAGFFVALKMVALVQNGKEPSMSNINSQVPLANMGEPPPHPPPPAKGSGPPTVMPQAPPGVWTITPQDRARYDQIFNSLGPEANKLHGNTVRNVMLNSKLPMDILGKIWDLSDMDKDGSLDRAEFSIAMHLVYKVLENNPLPPSIPQEMLSSARRAGVAQGPTPAPLAPPSTQQALIDNSKQQQQQQNKASGPPPAPWVVNSAEKARYDVMFHNADIDKDGFVSGNEIKGVFLQSGLPQMVLAHIWNLCDMKQTGKLTSEQFALAMWLIQQKLSGSDPPAALTNEMIPPTMRPKPSNESNVKPAKPQYSNPELQMVADEIEVLNADKAKLEAEIMQKEASNRVKNSEMQNLQTELDTLSSTLRQLEHQKGAAQQRLDDLGNQKKSLEAELADIKAMIEAEQEEVNKLRSQVEEQEVSLKAQEDEVLSKRQELTDLKTQETNLEDSIASMKKKIDKMGLQQQETQLHISQARIKITELQESEHQMTEVITNYDSAISSGDASSLSESSLRDVTPTFSDGRYLQIGPTPTTSPIESPKTEAPQQNGLPNQDDESASKARDTSIIDGHDPFASAFGGPTPKTDMFGGWDNQAAPASNPSPVPAAADPFGGDAFAHAGKGGVNDPFGAETFSSSHPPPRPESPTPALPPKKAKQPPPRPAPPKTKGPARPPPATNVNSNNNPTTASKSDNPTSNNANTGADPFHGGWGDKSKTNDNGGFADFANFADFDNKCSSVVPRREGSSPSPWGPSEGESSSSCATTPQPAFTTVDPFASPPFTTAALAAAPAKGGSSPWPQQDAFGSATFASDEGFESTAEFGADDPFAGGSGTEDPFAEDPFASDDPFKDHQGFKDEDKFSWDDEPDPFNTVPDSAGEILSDTANNNSIVTKSNKFDPFGININDIDDNLNTNVTNTTKDQFSLSVDNKNEKGNLQNNVNNNINNRSKSVLGDPFVSQTKATVPERSKTALGERMSNDFDPFSSTTVTNNDMNKWKSNEDLLNENFGSGWADISCSSMANVDWGASPTQQIQVPKSATSPFDNNFSANFGNKNNNTSKMPNLSEDEQFAWAAQESLKVESVRKKQEEQEKADLELALTLSRTSFPSVDVSRSSRSPSTGL
ncbi:unnamed protein product, partial [Meganyctiphanes norvegica]